MKTTKRKQEISNAIVAAAERIHLLRRWEDGTDMALAHLLGAISSIAERAPTALAEQLLKAVDLAIPQSAIRDPQSPTTGAQQ